MLGQKLDYLILRPFTHRHNIATEEELNSQANQISPSSIDNAIVKLQKYIRYLGGHIPVDDNLCYLDIGCGTGELTIALAEIGCKNITGVDFTPRNIATATLYAKQLQVHHCVKFICQDIYNWTPPHQYDVVLSFAAFEHIDNPKLLLQKMATLVTSNGIAVLVFGPLFHSPFGDHMWGFFRIPIPWRGVIFSEKAILRLRRECFRPSDPADRYQEIVGGLNLIRYSEFLKQVNETGWEFSFLTVNAFLKRFPPLYYLSSALIQMPMVRDYFAGIIYAILRRRSSDRCLGGDKPAECVRTPRI